MKRLILTFSAALFFAFATPGYTCSQNILTGAYDCSDEPVPVALTATARVEILTVPIPEGDADPELTVEAVSEGVITYFFHAVPF